MTRPHDGPEPRRGQIRRGPQPPPESHRRKVGIDFPYRARGAEIVLRGAPDEQNGFVEDPKRTEPIPEGF